MVKRTLGPHWSLGYVEYLQAARKDLDDSGFEEACAAKAQHRLVIFS